jgi:hypothetical protein
MEVFTNGEYQLDVSSEAGTRFDANVTGFRIETQFGANFTPYRVIGHILRVSGV